MGVAGGGADKNGCVERVRLRRRRRQKAVDLLIAEEETAMEVVVEGLGF